MTEPWSQGTPPTHVGPYAVKGTLGQGATGLVVRAAAGDREVAIKLLRCSAQADAVVRFQREARLLQQLGEADGFVPLIEAKEREIAAMARGLP